MKKLISILMLSLGFLSVIFGQKINDLVCINAKVFDPVPPAKRFSYVRVYHDWSDDMGAATQVGDNPNTPTVETCFMSSSNLGHCIDINQPCAWGYRWNPSFNQSGQWLNYSDYYAKFNGRVIPVLKGITQHYRGYDIYPNNITLMEQKPICPTTPSAFSKDVAKISDKALLPTPNLQEASATYDGHALWVSLFSARFGGSKITNTAVKSYLGEENLPQVAPKLINYLEDNNETNKNWLEPTGTSTTDFTAGNTLFYFSPSQYAAMFKADIDGNGNAMQTNQFKLGIRNTSNIEHIAMAGTTGLNGAYLKTAGLGFTNFIANFHHYSNDQTAVQNTASTFLNGEFSQYSGILFNTSGNGVCPEKDKLREKLRWLRKGNPSVPSVSGIGESYEEYWLSEFGYDSKEPGNSAVNVQLDNGSTTNGEKIQGQWLMRGVLETAWSKSIDKIMLYELRDDVSQKTNSYRYSGLLDDNGYYKRSWFYLMTLKNVIGEHSFENEIVNGQNGFTITTNPAGLDVRVYQFSKGSTLKEKAFAVWSPTASNILPFTCSITFPTGLTNIFNGVNSSTSFFTRVQELSEFGATTSSVNSSQTVQVLNVNETPLFLKFDGKKTTAPSHVTSLQCEAGCCGSVKLKWVNASNPTINHFVYYRKPSTSGTCPPFNVDDCTLFANNIGVNRTSIIVSGLDYDSPYCFYVIPVNKYGQVPETLETALSCQSTTTGGSTQAFLDITASELSFDPGYSNNASGLTILSAQVNYMFGVGSNKKCSTLKEACIPPPACGQPNQPVCCNASWPSWCFWNNPISSLPEPNTAFIHFAKPKILNTIFIQDWNGNGQLEIKYKYCNCNVWKTLTTVDLLGDFNCSANTYAPLRIVGNIPPIIITDLKITKLQPTVQIGHVFFCGEDAICPPPSIVTSNGGAIVNVDEIRHNSAVIHWEESINTQATDFQKMPDQYELKISQSKSTSETLINPISFQIEANVFDFNHFFRLEGLAPGTNYFGTISGSPLELDCPSTNPSSIFQFQTTTSALSDRSPIEKPAVSIREEDFFTIKMRPNPATDEATITISTGEIASISIIDGLGRTLRRQNGENIESMSLQLRGLQSGKYWLKVVNDEGASQVLFFIKQ